MSLVTEFRDMVTKRERQLAEIRQRVQEATNAIAQLMARNEADNLTEATLLRDIDVLNAEIARLSEHDEPVEQPRMSDEQIAAVVKGKDQSPTRAEVEQMARERHEAEEAASKGRRQKSKPDAVKARRKADRAKSRRDTDPTSVRHVPARTVANAPVGVKRPRHENPNTPDVDLSKASQRELDQAELVAMILEDGAMSKHEIGLALVPLIDGATLANTAPMASSSIGILKAQKRILFTGQKKATKKGGPQISAVWKLAAHATPPERAAAGLPIEDDNYAGTTSNWPTPSTTPGGHVHVQVASSQFESKR